MAPQETPAAGTIGWVDLTVPNADEIRDSYADVTGWRPKPVDMGDDADYSMIASTDQPAAGVCHARGGNADVPAQWLVYIVVADLDAALARVTARGS